MNLLEDKEIAVRFLFLGMVKIVIQKDIRNIQAGPFKIKEPYIELLEKIYFVATNERRKFKKVMWDRKIQVISLGKDGSYSRFKLIYRGREELQTYHNNMIRKHVKGILEELMRGTLIEK